MMRAAEISTPTAKYPIHCFVPSSIIPAPPCSCTSLRWCLSRHTGLRRSFHRHLVETGGGALL
jgi:hypothetical protein